MRRYLFSLIIGTGICSIAFAQKGEKEEKISNPPSVAKIAFTKNFPGVTGAKWEKEGKNYEANFKQNGKEMSAVYDSEGVLQETETTIKTTELPASITAYIMEHYKGAKIREASRITKGNSEVRYEAEVNGQDLTFDKDAKFLKAAKKD